MEAASGSRASRVGSRASLLKCDTRRFASSLFWLMVFCVGVGAADGAAGSPHKAFSASVYVYPRSLFRVSQCCNTSLSATRGENSGRPLSDERKHSVDRLFLRALLESESSTVTQVSDPKEADMFVIPIACSSCFPNSALTFDACPGVTVFDLVKDFMSKLIHLKRGRRDHIMVCDFWNSAHVLWNDYRHELPYTVPPEISFGYFELGGHANFVSGYSTFDAVSDLITDAPFRIPSQLLRPARERKYKMMHVSVPRFNEGGRLRAAFRLAVLNSTVVPNNFYFRFPGYEGQPVIPWSEVRRTELDSLIILSLPGDTSSTDRFQNAFDTNNIISTIDFYNGHDHVKQILDNLPFHHAVPWRDLILWINGTLFESDPVGALKQTVDSLSDDEADARLASMEKYRAQVSWAWSDSVVVHNILESARRQVEYI